MSRELGGRGEKKKRKHEIRNGEVTKRRATKKDPQAEDRITRITVGSCNDKFLNSLFCSKASVPFIHTSALSPLSEDNKGKQGGIEKQRKGARHEIRDRSSPSRKSLSHKIWSSHQADKWGVVHPNEGGRQRDREADMYPGQRQGLSGVSVSVSRLPALSRPHHTELHAPCSNTCHDPRNANTNTNMCATQIQIQILPQPHPTELSHLSRST